MGKTVRKQNIRYKSTKHGKQRIRGQNVSPQDDGRRNLLSMINADDDLRCPMGEKVSARKLTATTMVITCECNRSVTRSLALSIANQCCDAIGALVDAHYDSDGVLLPLPTA